MEGYSPGRWYLANNSVVGMVLFLSHFCPVLCLECYFVQAENLSLNIYFFFLLVVKADFVSVIHLDLEVVLRGAGFSF